MARWIRLLQAFNGQSNFNLIDNFLNFMITEVVISQSTKAMKTSTTLIIACEGVVLKVFYYINVYIGNPLTPLHYNNNIIPGGYV